VNAPELPIAHHFAALEDPRIGRATKKHSLKDILVIALGAVLGGADSWDDVEEFGRAKRDWLGQFPGLPNGIPSHDTFGRVFAALNPKAFQACFFSWMNAVRERCGLKRLQVDGKTVKGSHAKGTKGQGCLHLVSVWRPRWG
jgi:hypothetical protein